MPVKTKSNKRFSNSSCRSKIQDVMNGCTPLVFSIYSFDMSQELIMLPQLKQDSIYATLKRSIKINFLACISCPIGFQKIKEDARGCDCVCDVTINNCNYTRETIINKGATAYLTVKNISDYLIYPYCPMDYCFPPDTTVEINIKLILKMELMYSVLTVTLEYCVELAALD